MALVAEKQQYQVYNGAATTVITFPYALANPNAGANRTLLIFLAGDAPNSATYDGVGMAIAATDASPFCRVYVVEEVVLPEDTATRDIVLTYGGNRTNQAVLIAEFSGAEQLGAVPPAACNSAASGDPHSVNLTTTVDGVPVVLFYLRVEDRTMDAQPSGTVLLTQDAGTVFDGQRIIQATGPTPAGAQAYTFDPSGNSNGRVGAVQLEEAATSTPVEATGALTLPSLTLGGAADVAVQADAALSLPMLTLAATGAVRVGASGALSLPMLALSGGGEIGVAATAQLLMPSLVLAGLSDVQIQAAVALTLPMLALSGLAQGPSVAASGGVTLPLFTLGAAATVANVGRRYITGKVRMRPVVTGRTTSRPVVTGVVKSRPVVTASVKSPPGVGVPPGPAAAASLVLPMLTLSGAGTAETGPAEASGALALPMFTLAAQVVVPIEASGALPLPMLTLAGSGTVADPVVPLLHTFSSGDNASTVGVSDSGHIAQVFGGTWGITGGQCYRPVAAINSFLLWDCGTADGDMEVTFVVRGAEIGRIAVRGTDANNVYFFNSTVGNFVRRQAGANTSIGSTSAFADGDVAMIRCSGTSLELFRNGGSVLLMTGQTFNQTATLHGIGCFGSSGNASRFDDVSFTPA